jgi:hypothetical protein
MDDLMGDLFIGGTHLASVLVARAAGLQRAPSASFSPAAFLRLSRMSPRLRKGRRLGSRALKTWRPRRLPAPWVRFGSVSV